VPEKKAAQATTTRRSTPRVRTRKRRPDHTQIAERAYFISLEKDRSDDLANWLRAERELLA
jgi:Protein of unknown function (DUF2934)